MNFFKKNILFLVVFITGACVLIIEVAAVRILSPFYGNTIFTVSSVMGVILAALSVGYYMGGKFADRHPSLSAFYGIILISGLCVLFIQLLNSLLLPLLGYMLSIVSGPLISALLLFFVPSFFLGTLSPFAIKLQEVRLTREGIGSITGKVFFWSTFGSIFGSLFSGFVLIPHFGVNKIIVAVGILLTILGLIPLAKIIAKKRLVFKIMLLASIGMLILISFFLSQYKGRVIYSHDGVYEKITIYDGKYLGRPTRFFVQDCSYSGAMFLDSDELAFDYTKYYVLYQIFKPEIKEALAIGGGAYSVPRALLNELPDANIDVSEIEPSLFELGKKYFKVPDDKRLKNYVKDGRRLLHDTNKKYDLIFSDVYRALFSVPAHFTTEEFFQIARNKLSADGIFIANIVGSLSRQYPSLLFSEIKTFQSVFPNSYFFAVDSPEHLNAQNIIFVGYNSDKKIDFNNQQIKKNKNPIISGLAEKLINLDGLDFSLYPKLTDNFSPIEYLTANMLRKNLSVQNFISNN